MNPFRVYIGYDPRDDLAYRACVNSLLAHASVPVEPIPIRIHEVRQLGHFYRPYFVDDKGNMWDEQDRRTFSTEFSYTRFTVPLLEGFGDEWVMFLDADMLWREDVANLLELIEPDKGVMCVKHDHKPSEVVKGTGIQQQYARKNWSSVMLLRPSLCGQLTRYAVNRMSRDWLHGMVWMPDEKIGGLPERWNWLEGWSDPGIDPAIVHYTIGAPDFPNRENEEVPYEDEWWHYAKR